MMHEELGKAVYELLTLGQSVFITAGSGDSILIAALERPPAPSDYLVLGTLTDAKLQNGYEKATAQPPKVRKVSARRERVSGFEPLTCCLGRYSTDKIRIARRRRR